MEDDIKNIKVDFLSNHWLDLIQLSNLCSGDQTKTDEGELKMTSTEEDLNGR
jgi:hypothetical protein